MIKPFVLTITLSYSDIPRALAERLSTEELEKMTRPHVVTCALEFMTSGDQDEFILGLSRLILRNTLQGIPLKS